MAIKDDVAANLRNLRRESGLLINEVAARAGVSSNTLLRHEHGFDMTVTQLLGYASAPMEMPPRCYGLLLTRSSMGKKMVRLSSGANAAPDNDYRGEIVVYLTNDGIYPWMIRKGDRVAQVVVSPYVPCGVVEVDELSETQRGADGFGSTGR